MPFANTSAVSDNEPLGAAAKQSVSLSFVGHEDGVVENAHVGDHAVTVAVKSMHDSESPARDTGSVVVSGEATAGDSPVSEHAVSDQADVMPRTSESTPVLGDASTCDDEQVVESVVANDASALHHTEEDDGPSTEHAVHESSNSIVVRSDGEPLRGGAKQADSLPFVEHESDVVRDAHVDDELPTSATPDLGDACDEQVGENVVANDASALQDTEEDDGPSTEHAVYDSNSALGVACRSSDVPSADIFIATTSAQDDMDVVLDATGTAAKTIDDVHAPIGDELNEPDATSVSAAVPEQVPNAFHTPVHTLASGSRLNSGLVTKEVSDDDDDDTQMDTSFQDGEADNDVAQKLGKSHSAATRSIKQAPSNSSRKLQFASHSRPDASVRSTSTRVRGNVKRSQHDIRRTNGATARGSVSALEGTTKRIRVDEALVTPWNLPTTSGSTAHVGVPHSALPAAGLEPLFFPHTSAALHGGVTEDAKILRRVQREWSNQIQSELSRFDQVENDAFLSQANTDDLYPPWTDFDLTAKAARPAAKVPTADTVKQKKGTTCRQPPQ
jgi:hypothetical protein